MTRQLRPEAHYRIHDPQNFYAEMRRDVKLLLNHGAYVSLTTVIVCCLDALAAGSGEAKRSEFEVFVTKHFPELCAALEATCPGIKGAKTLWEKYRNGFAHLRGPKQEFAIAQDKELDGLWADRVKIGDVGPLVALNVDRLAQEFLKLLDQLEKDAAKEKVKGAG